MFCSINMREAKQLLYIDCLCPGAHSVLSSESPAHYCCNHSYSYQQNTITMLRMRWRAASLSRMASTSGGFGTEACSSTVLLTSNCSKILQCSLSSALDFMIDKPAVRHLTPISSSLEVFYDGSFLVNTIYGRPGRPHV